MEDRVIEYWTPEECLAGLCSEAEVGKVKGPLVEARRLAQRATPKAIKALVEVMDQTDDLGAKVKAAQVLLDRGWGRPDQHVSQDTSVVIDLPWITAQRLAYKQQLAVAEDIADKGLPAPTPKAENDS